MAFHDEGEVAALVGGRFLTERYCACDVGGAVEVLGTRVDQQQPRGVESGVRFGVGLIVYDGSVRAVAGDRAETFVEVMFAAAAVFAQDFGHVHFGGGAPFGHASLDLIERLDHGHAVAEHGGACAGELGLILDGLEHCYRRRGLDGAGAQQVDDGGGVAGSVDQYAGFARQRGQELLHGRVGSCGHALRCEIEGYFPADLGRVDE